MGASIEGLAQLRAELDALPDEIDEAAQEGADQVAEELAGDISADAPVRTGRLRSSVDAQGDEVHIGADYAQYVEDHDAFIAPNVEAMRARANKIVEVIIDKRIG